MTNIKQIGVFGLTKQQILYKICKIADGLPKDEIKHVKISLNAVGSYLELKNGVRYIGILTSNYARGYRWKQVYVPYNVDLNILRDVILPKIISDLPEHEQVIGYW